MLRSGLVRIILTAIVFESLTKGLTLMAPSKLLDQVSAVARLRHLSIRTEKAYRYHIKQFVVSTTNDIPTK